MIANYTVSGMTCHHCAHAITEEVSAVPGVTAVDVSLETGRASCRERVSECV